MLNAGSFYRVPDPQFCQGDIFRNVPHIHFKPPISALRKVNLSSQKEAYETYLYPGIPPAGDFKFGQGDKVISDCQIGLGIILTHDCEIDKDAKHRMLALIRPFDVIPEKDKQSIKDGRNFKYFYLPALQGVLNESYVDFRRISCVDPKFIESGERVASLTEQSVRKLLTQFFLYITRLQLNDQMLSDLTERRPQN